MTKKTIFDTQVLGHPAGLFVLFFTEMWERFSFYGMRVLLINFLTMTLIGYNPGWSWSTENATALFGTYAMLVYLTPILGLYPKCTSIYLKRKMLLIPFSIWE